MRAGDGLALDPSRSIFWPQRVLRVLRSREIVARARTADFELVYVRSGTLAVTHVGRALAVPSGNFVLLDNAHPYDIAMETPNDCLTAHLPEAWLHHWLPSPEEIAGLALPGDRGWGVPLAAMLQTIAAEGLSAAALPRSVIADQLGSLLALLAGQPAGSHSRHKARLLARLRQSVAERYQEAELSPEIVAAVHGISKRYLHTLFAEAGTSFGAVLLDARLARAAAMLTDQRYSGYRVGDISWSCGFSDASHFARRFRQRFGVSPLGYRRGIAKRPTARCEQ